MSTEETVFENSESLPFPGYEAALLSAPDGAMEIRALKPVKVWPATVKVGFSGHQVTVDVHIDPIKPFGAKDFKTLRLYPGHLEDEDTQYYGLFDAGSVHLKLRVDPKAQRVYVHVGVKIVGASIKDVNTNFPYSQFRFPDTRSLAHVKPATVAEVQAVLDKGTWKPMGKGKPRHKSDQSNVQNVFTMLGGQNFVADTRKHSEQGGLTLAAPQTALDQLFAIGLTGSVGEAASAGIGGGFYFTRDDLGVYGTASASIGFALEASIELEFAYYWGLGPGSALKNFSGVEFFVQVGGGYLGTASCALSFDLEAKPVGFTMGAGAGAGFSAAAGTSVTATHSFKKH